MDECALYTDPQLYDLLFPSSNGSAAVADEERRRRLIDSEAFYLDEARRNGGRVLELGCGSGRLTIPLAQSGIEIMGADLSDSMLDAARLKAAAAGVQVGFVHADMRSFELGERFSAILIPGNSLLHLLTMHELKECFACVRRHLVEGGHLVFDISKWDLSLLARDAAQRHPVLRVNDIVIEETAEYDAASQIRHIRWHFSRLTAPDFRTIDYSLRVVFPQELPLLLEAVGLRLESRFGEFPRQPFESNSPRQVCICC